MLVGYVLLVDKLYLLIKVALDILNALVLERLVIGIDLCYDKLKGGILAAYALVNNDLVYTPYALNIALERMIRFLILPVIYIH